MNKHVLKTVQPYFDDVASGKKTFEIRKNDRNFQVGDLLRLVEHPASGYFVNAKIIYMTDFEQKEGYVVLGIEAEKAKQITPVKPSDTEIIEYYEQVAKEDFTEKKTCKWKDASTYSIIHPGKNIAPLYVSPHLSKIEGQRGCFISKQDLSNYEYCPYPGCGKPIEVVE